MFRAEQVAKLLYVPKCRLRAFVLVSDGDYRERTRGIETADERVGVPQLISGQPEEIYLLTKEDAISARKHDAEPESHKRVFGIGHIYAAQSLSDAAKTWPRVYILAVEDEVLELFEFVFHSSATP